MVRESKKQSRTEAKQMSNEKAVGGGGGGGGMKKLERSVSLPFSSLPSPLSHRFLV